MLTHIGNLLTYGGMIASLLLLLPILFLFTNSKTIGDVCNALSGFFLSINKHLSQFIMWAGLMMALIQLTVVIMRYVYGVNFIWLQESILYLFGFLFLLTSGFALINNEHVRVDIFYRDASPIYKARVDFLGTYLFLLPVCILIIWAASPYVARSWADFEGSREASGIHAVFILKSLIPLFAVLLASAGFTIATRSVSILKNKGA